MSLLSSTCASVLTNHRRQRRSPHHRTNDDVLEQMTQFEFVSYVYPGSHRLKVVSLRSLEFGWQTTVSPRWSGDTRVRQHASQPDRSTFWSTLLLLFARSNSALLASQTKTRPSTSVHKEGVPKKQHGTSHRRPSPPSLCSSVSS